MVGQQSTNREKHSPVISAFRWWARRQHAVVGALIEAAEDELGRDGFLGADPFSGGGTVAIEAARPTSLRSGPVSVAHTGPGYGLDSGLA